MTDFLDIVYKQTTVEMDYVRFSLMIVAIVVGLVEFNILIWKKGRKK